MNAELAIEVQIVEIENKELVIATVKPGDVIVFRTPHLLHPAARANIGIYLTDVFPNNRNLVIDRGDEIKVVRQQLQADEANVKNSPVQLRCNATGADPSQSGRFYVRFDPAPGCVLMLFVDSLEGWEVGKTYTVSVENWGSAAVS